MGAVWLEGLASQHAPHPPHLVLQPLPRGAFPAAGCSRPSPAAHHVSPPSLPVQWDNNPHPWGIERPVEVKSKKLLEPAAGVRLAPLPSAVTGGAAAQHFQELSGCELADTQARSAALAQAWACLPPAPPLCPLPARHALCAPGMGETGIHRPRCPALREPLTVLAAAPGEGHGQSSHVLLSLSPRLATVSPPPAPRHHLLGSGRLSLTATAPGLRLLAALWRGGWDHRRAEWAKPGRPATPAWLSVGSGWTRVTQRWKVWSVWSQFLQLLSDSKKHTPKHTHTQTAIKRSFEL